MAEFRMPSLGADMDTGTITEWLVHPGETVHKGDIVAVVDTAKSAVEVETFSDGVIDDILVEPGHEVPVGTVLAMIHEEGAAAESREAPAPPSPAPAGGTPPIREPHRAAPPRPYPPVRHLAAEAGLDISAVHGTGQRGRVTRADVERAIRAQESTAAHGNGRRRPRVTPYARRLAGELGVDLSALHPSGPDGRIDADLVRAAAARHAAPQEGPAEVPAEVPAREAPAPGGPVRTTGATPAEGGRPAGHEDMRAAIARLMAASKRDIPHYYLRTTIDLSRASAWLRDHNRRVPIAERVVPAALLLKATALAAKRYPDLNGHWVDGAFRPAPSVRLGVAISLRGGGLIAPAIDDADRLSVPELMAALRDLVTRARAGRLRRTELLDPSITVTNLGDQGVESVFGVIYPPQVALVGFGRVMDRPVAVDGLIGIRPTVTATLSGDHRATDGFTGGRFLTTIDELLQTPEDS